MLCIQEKWNAGRKLTCFNSTLGRGVVNGSSDELVVKAPFSIPWASPRLMWSSLFPSITEHIDFATPIQQPATEPLCNGNLPTSMHTLDHLHGVSNRASLHYTGESQLTEVRARPPSTCCVLRVTVTVQLIVEGTFASVFLLVFCWVASDPANFLSGPLEWASTFFFSFSFNNWTFSSYLPLKIYGILSHHQQRLLKRNIWGS